MSETKNDALPVQLETAMPAIKPGDAVWLSGFGWQPVADEASARVLQGNDGVEEIAHQAWVTRWRRIETGPQPTVCGGAAAMPISGPERPGESVKYAPDGRGRRVDVTAGETALDRDREAQQVAADVIDILQRHLPYFERDDRDQHFYLASSEDVARAGDAVITYFGLDRAWLIHGYHAGRPIYWAAIGCWSHDVNVAVRFLRRRDAEAVAQAFAPDAGCFVSEHVWMPSKEDRS